MKPPVFPVSARDFEHRDPQFRTGAIRPAVFCGGVAGGEDDAGDGPSGSVDPPGDDGEERVEGGSGRSGSEGLQQTVETGDKFQSEPPGSMPESDVQGLVPEARCFPETNFRLLKTAKVEVRDS